MAETGPTEALVNSWLAGTFNVQTLYLQLHTGPPGPAGTANVLADTPRQPLTFSVPDNGYVETIGAAPEFSVGADGNNAFGSIWNDFEAGTHKWNVVANSSIPLVEGDKFIASDDVKITVEGWI
jgi:hypothetical protein